jgi:hypothetical protein
MAQTESGMRRSVRQRAACHLFIHSQADAPAAADSYVLPRFLLSRVSVDGAHEPRPVLSLHCEQRSCSHLSGLQGDV